MPKKVFLALAVLVIAVETLMRKVCALLCRSTSMWAKWPCPLVHTTLSARHGWMREVAR
jgi:hypothetical protein